MFCPAEIRHLTPRTLHLVCTINPYLIYLSDALDQKLENVPQLKFSAFFMDHICRLEVKVYRLADFYIKVCQIFHIGRGFGNVRD